MWTRYFWLSALERALKTFAQTAVALLGGDGLGLVDVDWLKALSISGMAALISLLTSIASSKAGPDGSPSLVGEPPKEPAELLEPDPAPDPEDATPSGRHVLDDEPDDIPVSDFTNPTATRYDRKEPRDLS